MFLLDAFNDPVLGVTKLITLVVGLTIHEYAHAWSAWRFGDSTAANAGRLTLNPLRHLDVMGSIVFLIAGFGWAKPVPINPYTLGRRGVFWVALAGPISNLLLATLALVPLRFLPIESLPNAAITFLLFFGALNIGLAIFNLIPVAPLDGWKVLLGSVDSDTAWKLSQYETYGPMVLLLIIFAPRLGGPDVIGTLIGTAQRAIIALLSGLQV